MVGRSKGEEEKEPEGIAVVGPSGEAIVYSSGNTPFFSNKSFPELFYTTFYCIILLNDWVDLHPNSCFPLISWPILLVGESDEDGEAVVETKEEQELGWYKIGWSGGLPALPKEEAWGCPVFIFMVFAFEF